MRCTKCHKPRFKRVGKSLVPTKVLRYFLLIPRLKRMYSTPVMAVLMVWHRLGRSTDGLIWHVIDSLQWKWVDEQLGDFGKEDRNVGEPLWSETVKLEHLACMFIKLQCPVMVDHEETFYHVINDNPREEISDL
jgi:hypothetical protein